MTADIALRYLHFLCVFVIFATLTAEHMLLKPVVARAEIVRLARIDAAYGIAAMLLLAVGLTLWLGGYGKPAAFYSGNWIFHLKLTCFVAIGLLSIRPTLFILRNRAGSPHDQVTVPRGIRNALRIELALLIVMPLLAGLMAHGVGLNT
ncbi:MAG TPA: DUF2214 family protein [Burkholderiaceae bacterium]